MSAAATRASRNGKPRVLVLSRSYPNNVLDLLGIWVKQVVRATREICEPAVVSPVPWAPPGRFVPAYYRRFRDVERTRMEDGVPVYHPRFVAGPGSSLERLEPRLYHAAVRGVARKLHATAPFDLVHAHFSYPDGVVAARLANELGVPFVVTEQAPWGPWLDEKGFMRRDAVKAVGESAAVIAISTSVRDSIAGYLPAPREIDVIPDPVDGDVFELPGADVERVPNQILFVGVIREVKGVDVLVDAVRLLLGQGRDVRLLVAGEGHYRNYQLQQAELERETEREGLADRIRFIGKQPVSELVSLMQRSAVLVLPSRAESLGMVLVEALACGTPVVATRCGGPEDIVTPDVGTLVPPEDPEALAAAIADVLERGGQFERESLRAHALERFGAPTVAARIERVYARVLERSRG